MTTPLPFRSRQNAPLPEGWEQLYSAVLSDSLDAIGVTNQAMTPAIRPLDDMQKALLKASAALYAAKQREYAAGLKRVD